MVYRHRHLANCTKIEAVKRVVIVAAKESYRTGDFLEAARLLRIEPIVATDAPTLLPAGRQIQIDLSDPASAAREIAAMEPAPDAVVAIDDQGVVIAAEAAAKLGLKHNAPQAVHATRDKLVMRQMLDVAESRNRGGALPARIGSQKQRLRSAFR